MKISRIERILESMQPFSMKSAIQTFNDRIDALGFEGVEVVDIDFDFENDIYVTFKDDDNDYMQAIFIFDEQEEESTIVIEPENENDDEEEVAVIDITPMSPPLLTSEMGVFIDLSNLNWMNKSLLEIIFKVSDLDYEGSQLYDGEWPEYDYNDDDEDDEDNFGESKKITRTDEMMKTVIRGGKKIRVPVVRKRRKKRLTAKQKMGVRKGTMKRKAHKSQIARSRKKSLKIRKRSNLKTGTPKGYKVQGT